MPLRSPVSGKLRRVLLASSGAFAVAVVLTACGGSSASSSSSSGTPSSNIASSNIASPSSGSVAASPSAAGPNPCKVLTNAEIAAILGSDPGTAARDTEPTGCTYSGGLAISVAPADPAVDAVALMTSAGAPDVQALEGVGDNAAYADFKSQGVILLVAQQGGMQVGIYAVADVDKASKLAEAMLAKAAAP
jgi:hypothetical protein